ncbi:hypothetical protein BDW02DRAFT_539871 [Decorospora gaudefroyi]|uniref:Uncharacterized protein n=1 Tax=Decorospora gaudefroyi TaxID=184978 RepID=A0A6A5KVU5_9PLEO|nr:hypothetical protein BDW02DRAFT_539871 [Decorospora gaudefroyi]
METERIGPVLRSRGNAASSAKKLTPLKVKRKTISAAAVFKQPKSRTTQRAVTPRANPNGRDFTVEDADATTLLSVKPHLSSRSPGKGSSRKRSSDMHPLGIAFKETSASYRRHLYQTSFDQINKTLEDLLHRLYESTLQPISNQQDPTASPLRLSAPAKYERLATQVYQPISKFTLMLRRTNSEGQSVRFEQTLEMRMQHYDERLEEQTAKLMELQKEWEGIVGEIWKVGVRCLGEGAMEDLMSTKQRDEALVPSSPSKATNAESTLFVPEQGTSPSPPRRKSKKRVSFVDNTSSTSTFPNFLYQPSRYRSDDALPVVSAIPATRIKELENTVTELGKREIEHFRNIERDHRAYWKRKTAQLAVALKED